MITRRLRECSKIEALVGCLKSAVKKKVVKHKNCSETGNRVIMIASHGHNVMPDPFT